VKFVIDKARFLAIISAGMFLIGVISANTASPPHRALQDSAPCLKCHKKTSKETTLKYQHKPFAKGNCSYCHNPHTSSYKWLLKEDTNNLCLSCHNSLRESIKKGIVHGAIGKETCIECHEPHASQLPNLMKEKETNLCIKCHKEVIEKDLKLNVLHEPFKTNKCSSCHVIHASSYKNLLKNKPNQMCKSCHEPRCKLNTLNISQITKGMDCTLCHASHSSNYKGLLGPYGHSDFLNKKCDSCHGPISQVDSFKAEIKTEKCLKCHSNTTINKNDTHYGLSENACSLCHYSHGSNNKQLVKKDSTQCLSCHKETVRKIKIMEKKLKGLKKSVLRNSECLECHTPVHSSGKYLLRGNDELGIKTCARCHPREHENTHPIGKNLKDPRTGGPLTCSSCHSMHEARYKYLLYYHPDRELCIQCHKLY
jgi:predicted CXXCH cytochrome family protein